MLEDISLPHDPLHKVGDLVSLRGPDDNNGVHAVDHQRGKSIFLPQNTTGLILDIIRFQNENLILYVVLVLDKQLLLPEQNIFKC